MEVEALNGHRRYGISGSTTGGVVGDSLSHEHAI